MNESVLSIVTGIITATIIYLAVIFFKKIFQPWIEDLLYKGTDISGEWYSENSIAGLLQSIQLTLDQKASIISGTAIFSNPKASVYEEHRLFSVEGKIKDRFILLSLFHKDKKRIGITSLLLEIVGDGRKMLGCVSGYSVTGCKITSSEITFLRNKSEKGEIKVDNKQN